MKKRMERVRQLAEEKRVAAGAARMKASPDALASATAHADAVDKLQQDRDAARAEEVRKLSEKREQEEALLQRDKRARDEARQSERKKRAADEKAQREVDRSVCGISAPALSATDGVLFCHTTDKQPSKRWQL